MNTKSNNMVYLDPNNYHTREFLKVKFYPPKYKKPFRKTLLKFLLFLVLIVAAVSFIKFLIIGAVENIGSYKGKMKGQEQFEQLKNEAAENNNQ